LYASFEEDKFGCSLGKRMVHQSNERHKGQTAKSALLLPGAALQ
jgi:hypothetical protein